MQLKHLYMKKTKKFNTIITKMYFPFSFQKQDILKKAMLPSMLVYTNEKYPKEEDYRREISKYGIFSLSAEIIEIGKQHFLVFTLIIPDKKTIKEDLLKEALIFFLDTIYHPNIVKNAFEKNLFEKKKRILQMDIENVFYHIGAYHNYKIWSILDPEEEYIVSSINHKEELGKLSAEDVYSFYKKVVPGKEPLIFIYGDFIKKTAEETILKYLSEEKVAFSKDFHPIYRDFFTKKIEKEIKIEEKKPFRQSYLTYVYKVQNMKEEDIVPLKCIDAILSGAATDLLMKKLRNELGIVYSTFSRRSGDESLLFITAKLYKENREKAEKGIEEVMDLLRNKTKVQSFLQAIKEEIKIYKMEKEDSKFFLLDNYIDSILETGRKLDDFYDKILSITVEDITSFMPRVKKIVTCFIEGDESE